MTEQPLDDRDIAERLGTQADLDFPVRKGSDPPLGADTQTSLVPRPRSAEWASDTRISRPMIELWITPDVSLREAGSAPAIAAPLRMVSKAVTSDAD